MCLEKLIGISEAGDSGLYVTALPGISLENLNKIADKAEQQDADGVFKDVQIRVLNSFRNAFTAEINECYKISDLKIINTLICENKDILAVALWYLFGAEIMAECLMSNRLNRYTMIDRKKAKEQQEYFTQKFYEELTNAVKGINPNASLPEPVEHKSRIVTVQVTP